LIEWADVINAYDDYDLPKGKPGVKTYLGSYYRQLWPMENAKTTGIQRFCPVINLELYGANWISLPADKLPEATPDDKFLTFAHAPTNRELKGTQEIIEAFKGVGGVELDIIENVTYDECLQRKSAAHVVIDQIGENTRGYGCNSLEAWAMGQPVIANATDEICDLIKKEVGYLPFIRVRNGEEMKLTIEILRDPKVRKQWADVGKKYLEDWHDPQKVANKFIALCYGAME